MRSATVRGESLLVEARKLSIAVLGTPEHEGRMCGRAFEILGVTPVYLDPANPVLPASPPPDLVLLSREWSVDIRQATIQACRHGIPVVYIMDGVIEWDYFWHNWGFVKPEGTVFQPLIATDLCVIGQHPARILAALGLADRIHIVGLPRLDGVARRRVVNLDRPRRIVIATAMTFGQNTAHKVFVRAALRDLKVWFDSHKELIPVWCIAKDLAGELALTSETVGSMLEVLESASGVVSFTSTVLLEAMRLGVPTAQVDYRAVPQYVSTAWEIRNPDQIDGVIQELLFPPAEKLAYQEACLSDELEAGDASQRLADVIRACGDPKVTPARDTGVNGLLDFRQVNSQLSAFSVGPLSRLQYELDATYKIWERDRQRLTTLASQVEELQALVNLHRSRELAHSLAELESDPLTRIIQKFAWLPGLRRTARVLRALLSSHH